MAFSLKALLTKHTKKRTHKWLWLLPFACTLANAVLGLIAILFALESNFASAAYSIMGAAIMDMFDGRLARALGVTSGLGAELDSLSDAVSFCLAPAVILYSLIDEPLLLIAVCAYLCAGLVRLARFMVTKANMYNNFSGLPTTAAALWLAAYIVWHTTCSILAYESACIGVAVILLAILMTSTIHYPAFKQCSLSNPLHVLKITGLMLFLMIGWYLHYPVVLITLTAYIGAGMLTAIAAAVKRFMRYAQSSNR